MSARLAFYLTPVAERRKLVEFIKKSYILLVFAGVWALMHGVTDIVRAFQIRSLRSN